jgi:Squalene-hopene cyclase N-terminal domain
MTPRQLPDSYFRDFLTSNQNPDGGWSFHPATASACEATAWALMALISSPLAPVCLGARDWLVKTQRPDGSWPALPGQPEGCWVTSVAAHALHRQGESPSAVERARGWLLKAWPAEGTAWWRVRQALFPSRIARQDTSLRGWNWTPGTASWVEPTAQSLLFLRSQPAAALSPLAARRRQLAERLLFDRMCPGGGWNSGNPLVYGVAGIPRIGPTAWALLALRDHSDRSEIQMSVNWLEGAYAGIRGAASLALAHRCLLAYGRKPPALAPALAEFYSHNRFFENVLTIAWVTLALNEEQSSTPLPPAEAVNP